MKNYVLIFSALVFLLASCGIGESPTKVVNSYFTEIQKGTKGELAKFVDSAIKKRSSGETALSEVHKQSLESFSSKFEGKVVSETIKDDIAMVTAEVTGIDLRIILKDLFSEILGHALTDNELSEAEIHQRFNEKLKTAETSSRTGVITLRKKNDVWQIQKDDAFETLLVGLNDSDFATQREREEESLPFELTYSKDYHIRASKTNEQHDIFIFSVTFKNMAKEATSADMTILFSAFNEDTGIEMDRAFDSVVNSENVAKDVRPGSSITFEVGFYLKKGERPSMITVEAEEAFSFSEAKEKKAYRLNH
ncbi:MAG: hypothetical protein ACRC5C_02100 [Bacilli bacterium]